MKDSTNLSFIIKILALVVLLLVGYSKEQLFSVTEWEKEKFMPSDSESGTAVYFTPLTTSTKTSSLVSLTSKK